MIDLSAVSNIDTWTHWMSEIVSIRFSSDGEEKRLMPADAIAFIDAIEKTGVDVTFLRDKITR